MFIYCSHIITCFLYFYLVFFGIVSATSLPSVASCPGDLGFVVERDYVLEWESAVFGGVDSSVKSNYITRGIVCNNCI